MTEVSNSPQVTACCCKIFSGRVVLEAQLPQSLPTPEDQGSNPAINDFLLLTVKKRLSWGGFHKSGLRVRSEVRIPRVELQHRKKQHVVLWQRQDENTQHCSSGLYCNGPYPVSSSQYLGKQCSKGHYWIDIILTREIWVIEVTNCRTTKVFCSHHTVQYLQIKK